MDVMILGYQELNFNTKEGDHIEGIKFYYYYNSDNPKYRGYEVGSLFVPIDRVEIISVIRKLNPLSKVHLNMGFNGRRAIFQGITPIRS